MSSYLVHYGILGQKWGDRNGPPYPLGSSKMSAEERKLARKDIRWAKKTGSKIQRKTEKAVKADIKRFERQELRKKYKTKNSYYVNAYNKKLAELMNESIGDIPSPSGQVLRFVAKRGEYGVYKALASPGYDMTELRNGVFTSGKVAYRKRNVNMVSN